jgi:hypothetical protein
MNSKTRTQSDDFFSCLSVYVDNYGGILQNKNILVLKIRWLKGEPVESIITRG